MHTRVVVIIVLYCAIVWLNNITPCSSQVVTCEDPGNPANGSSFILPFRSNGTLPVGTVIRYTCSLGFKLVGSTIRFCRSNGEWSGTAPACQLICQNFVDCGPLVVPPGGSVRIRNASVGCEAMYRCSRGNKLVSGNATRVCPPNGTWSGTTPTCEPVDCGKPSDIDNGATIYINTLFKSLVMYRCNNGFELVGNLIHICGLSGLWLGGVPLCRPLVVNCGRPEIPPNGFISDASTTVGSTITYSCAPSYALCGNDTRTCLPDGNWTGMPPRCIRPTAFMKYTSYSVNEGDNFVNITVMLNQSSCVNVSVTLILLSVNASKSDFDNTNITMTIPPGDTEANVSIPIYNNVRVEKVEIFNVLLYSNDGSVAIGFPNQSRVAIFDDDSIRLSFEQSTYLVTQKRIELCVKKSGKHDFPITVQIQNQDAQGSILSNQSLTFKIKQTILCYRQKVFDDDESFSSFNATLVPNEYVKIGTNGSAEIIMRCEDPDELVNGSSQFRGTAFGMVVTFSCDDEFELNGTRSIRCLDTGLWSGSVPTCDFVTCSVEDQQYLPCNGRCDLTCAEDPPVDESCPFCITECRCPSGTVLDEIANRCVKREDCSEDLDENF